jgi:hypothetical protein
MTTIEVIEYSKNRRNEWNEFVLRSNNGTIFHNIDFLNYHPEGRFDEHHLMFYKGSSTKGGSLIGVMPMALFREEDKIIAKSPYGASFGGIVVECFLTFEDSEHIVDGLINYLSNLGIAHLYIAPPPHIYNNVASDYIEFNLLRRGAMIAKREITNVIDLTSFSSDPFEIYAGRNRTAIRKAEKLSLIIRESWEALTDFYGILMETYNHHSKLPTHNLDELVRLKELLPASFKLDMAYFDNEPIGGALYFICNPRVASLFYDCRKSEYSAYNPVNLLLHRGILWAKQQGFKYLDLGRTTGDMQPNYGLFQFKESLGAVGIFRDTYRLEL